MYYELYIDVFFCVNLSMDLLVLYIMKRWMKLSGSVLRLLFASAFGAGMICLYLFLPCRGKIFVFMIVWMIAGFGMIQIAFVLTEWKSRLKLFLIFYVVNLFVNGVANYFFVRVGGARMLLLSIGVTFFVIKIGEYVFRWLSKNEKTIYTVHIIYQGTTIVLKGLWDTGNCLVSPYHQRGVSIVSYEILNSYLKEDTKQKINVYLSGMDENYEEGDEAVTESDKVFVIPYRTISQAYGIMPVLRVDMLRIHMQGECVEYEKALLGIVKGQVSSTNEYQIILTTKG